MLNENRAIAFVPVGDVDRAMHFYSDVLALPVIDAGAEYCALDAGGFTLRLTAIPDRPHTEHTVVGWSVDEITGIAAELANRGVAFQRYEGVEQDEYGVWTSPNGDRVAWFCDPDGNTLSITQFAPVGATASV